MCLLLNYPAFPLLRSLQSMTSVSPVMKSRRHVTRMAIQLRGWSNPRGIYRPACLGYTHKEVLKETRKETPAVQCCEDLCGSPIDAVLSAITLDNFFLSVLLSRLGSTSLPGFGSPISFRFTFTSFSTGNLTVKSGALFVEGPATALREDRRLLYQRVWMPRR